MGSVNSDNQMSKYIARFITHKDYKCNHCHRLPPDFYSEDGGIKSRTPVIYQEFFEAYEKFREPWGKPIHWTSGYRCPYWNAQVGGSSMSVHLFGLAGDLECEDNDELEGLYKCILTFSSELRLGKYKERIINGKKRSAFIHFDVGFLVVPRLTRKWHKMARWTG